MDISVNSVVSATMALKNQNVQEAFQMSLLRDSLDQATQSMSKLLEALPQPALSHLGRAVDIRA
jgi:hypothetical protein